MSKTEKSPKRRGRGKYQLLMQGVILALLFAAAFILLFFSASYVLQKNRSNWEAQQQRMAWYERNGFRTRIRMINTEIEALTADADILTFAETEAPYAYSTIRAFRKLYQNTTFFSAGPSALQMSSSYPESRVVGSDGTMSKEEFLRHELRLDREQKAEFAAFIDDPNQNFYQTALCNADGSFRELLRCYRRSTPGYDLFFFSRLRPGFFLEYHHDLPFILLEQDGTVLAMQNASGLWEKTSGLFSELDASELDMLLSSQEPLIREGPERTPMVIYSLPDTSLSMVIYPGEMPKIAPYLVLLFMAFIPLLILLAVFLSRTISRQLYKPIEMALGPLQDEAAEDEAGSEAEERAEKEEDSAKSGRLDELELITRRLENYRRITDDLDALQKEQALYRDRDFYANLLEGYVLPQYRDSALFQAIESGRHTVTVLNFSETGSGGSGENIVIYQELQTAFSSETDCRMINDGVLRFTLIFLDTEEETADAIVRRHMDQINPTIPWYAAVSATREGSKGLEVSYRECLQLIDFRYRLPEGNFLYAEDLPSLHSDYYYYPVSEEQRLTRLIVDGSEDALPLFDKLWRDNTVQRALSAGARKDFVFALVHTFRRSAQELKISLNQLPAIRHDLPELIEEHWEEPEIAEDLRALLKALVNYKKVRGSSEDEILKEKMYRFIAGNYYDDIMLNDLADYLGFTPKYCSALFPKLMESNFKEYLNRYRITQAIRILNEDPDILVNDLAATVGFNSANSFIRVFRQFTGTTPGRYLKEQ